MFLSSAHLAAARLPWNLFERLLDRSSASMHVTASSSSSSSSSSLSAPPPRRGVEPLVCHPGIEAFVCASLLQRHVDASLRTGGDGVGAGAGDALNAEVRDDNAASSALENVLFLWQHTVQQTTEAATALRELTVSQTSNSSHEQQQQQQQQQSPSLANAQSRPRQSPPTPVPSTTATMTSVSAPKSPRDVYHYNGVVIDGAAERRSYLARSVRMLCSSMRHTMNTVKSVIERAPADSEVAAVSDCSHLWGAWGNQ